MVLDSKSIATPTAAMASSIAVSSGPPESRLTSLVPSASAAPSKQSVPMALSAGTGTLPKRGFTGGTTIKSWTSVMPTSFWSDDLEEGDEPHERLSVDGHDERRVAPLVLHLKVLERRSEPEDGQHVH